MALGIFTSPLSRLGKYSHYSPRFQRIIVNYITIYGFFYLASSNKEIADNQCFLFTLANPFRTEPIKITPKRDAAAGIRCGTGLGPRFIEKNNALDVDEGGSGLIGTQDLNSGFLCPQNADHKTFFTGKRTFNVTELEVFQVDF